MHMALSHTRNSVAAYLTAFLMAWSQLASRAEPWARALEHNLPVDLSGEVDVMMEAAQGYRGRAAQVQTVIAGVVIGAALLIGFFVVAQIDDALPTITDSDLSTDKNDTLDRIGDGLLIGGVVIIVLFAAVILRVLRGL